MLWIDSSIACNSITNYVPIRLISVHIRSEIKWNAKLNNEKKICHQNDEKWIELLIKFLEINQILDEIEWNEMKLNKKYEANKLE